MRRIALCVEYDGTNYCGWQRQHNGVAVQQVLEEALEKVSGTFSPIQGAGRTDAGVHALGQAAHFDTECGVPAERFYLALNSRLPEDIRVTRSFQVPEDFNARFNAHAKEYRYVMLNRSCHSALMHDRAWNVHVPLDADRMNEAAKLFCGRRDYAAFQAAGSSAKTTVRNVLDARVYREGELVTLSVTGEGFLYNMVRILTGTLVLVGTGELQPADMTRILESRDRRQAGPTAPPQGLYLYNIRYETPAAFDTNPAAKNLENRAFLPL